MVQFTPSGRMIWNDEAHVALLVAYYQVAPPNDDEWQQIRDSLKPKGFECSVVAFKQHIMKLRKKENISIPSFTHGTSDSGTSTSTTKRTRAPTGSRSSSGGKRKADAGPQPSFNGNGMDIRSGLAEFPQWNRDSVARDYDRDVSGEYIAKRVKAETKGGDDDDDEVEVLPEFHSGRMGTPVSRAPRAPTFDATGYNHESPARDLNSSRYYPTTSTGYTASVSQYPFGYRNNPTNTGVVDTWRTSVNNPSRGLREPSEDWSTPARESNFAADFRRRPAVPTFNDNTYGAGARKTPPLGGLNRPAAGGAEAHAAAPKASESGAPEAGDSDAHHESEGWA
ncbi:hypothetical protein TruAng_000399 [Truncatella angustata]|nr:hypothetical protein TruAng_000399 [Truncatella angustata]